MAKRRSKISVRCTAKIRDRARRLARSRGFSTVLCGHTHHAESLPGTPAMPVAYHNSGCWTEKPCSYLSIHNGRVRAHAYQMQQAAVPG
jgi:UDP-2,3-diacylglucosamine pyrophosphatase LpxH